MEELAKHKRAHAQATAVGAIWRMGPASEVRGAGGKAGAGTSIGTALHSGQVGSPDRGDEGVGGARPLPSSHVSMQDTWNCHESGRAGTSRRRAEREGGRERERSLGATLVMQLRERAEEDLLGAGRQAHRVMARQDFD